MHRRIFLTVVFLKATAFSQAHLPQPVSATHNNITVTVLPQVELMSIVQSISNYPSILGFLMASDSAPYNAEVQEQFQPYAYHPVVHMFDRLSSQPRMLNFNAPSFIMLYTDASLHLRTDIELDDFVVQRAGGLDSLNVLLQLLRDFAEQSEFYAFYEAHRDFYARLVQNTANHIGGRDYISELEFFYGKQQKGYNLVLAPLYNFVGFGNSLVYKTGERELFTVLGRHKVQRGLQTFGDEAYLKYMIRHEFSHPFVNPLTEQHWDLIKEYSENYEAIPEKAKKSMCGDWQECINEFTIRAITTHLASLESDSLGAAWHAKETGRGVAHLDVLMEKIQFYQQHREDYPTFESFYPQMLEVFE